MHRRKLVGYVGAANAAEYEKEDKNPLLLVPGVKIGKEGLEKALMTLLATSGRCRGLSRVAAECGETESSAC